MEEEINLELALVHHIYWNYSPFIEHNDFILQAALSRTSLYILNEGVYRYLVNHYLLYGNKIDFSFPLKNK